MKLLLFLSLAHNLAEASPNIRPIDMVNPYQAPVYTILDQREYDTVRRQVAQVCQDLSWVLDHKLKGDSKADELRSVMDQCTADDMEWSAIQACSEAGIQAPMCPVMELLLMDVGYLQATIDAAQ